MRKTKDVRLALSRAEIETQLQGAKLRDKALIKLAFLTAARVSELVELKPEDLRVEEDFLIVEIATRKNPEEPVRAIPIPLDDPWVHDILAWLEEVKKSDSAWLFPGRGRERHLTDRAVRKIISKYGLGWPHRLRHSRLTELARKGASDQKLTKFAGWSDSRPAKFYIHLDWRDLRDVV